MPVLDSADPQPTIGKYKIQGKLGSGSFGQVFRVEAPDSTLYALKLVPSGAPKDADSRLENEIFVLKKLRHASIPKLVDTGDHEGRPYLVETLAAGESLRELIKKQRAAGGTMPQTAVLAIASAALSALAHMQGLGIVHRDVKDDNVVATPMGDCVTLVDFGYCKAPNQPAEVESPTNVGALKYAPPSKLHHPAFVHGTHDVFAVGVLAYLLLTNYYPWDISAKEDVGDLIGRMEARPLIPISHLNVLSSTAVSDFVASLLAIHDDARPSAPQAKVLCDDLRKTLNLQLSQAPVLIDRLWSERAQQYLLERIGPFPQHLNQVVEFVTQAKKSLRLVVDCLDNGSFSAPELHDRVIRAIEDAGRDSSRRELKIEVLVCGKPAPISATSPYWGFRFEDLVENPDFIKVFEHYCIHHRVDDRPTTDVEFRQLLMTSHAEFMTRLRKASMLITVLPDELVEGVPCFFWMRDDDVALFSFTHARASKRGEFFRTRDRAFLDFLASIFERFTNKRS